MLNNRYLEQRLANNIKVYLDKNYYLFTTDTPYTVHCHLKPRLISNAIEYACSKCKKDGTLDIFQENKIKLIYYFAIDFAVKYMKKLENK